jgi:release factor glutamine methyltransferase
LNGPASVADDVGDTLTPETSHRDAMAILIRAFETAGVPDAAFDARLLLCAAANIDHSSLIRDPQAPLDHAARETLLGFARRRVAREPVTRIIGERGFWSLDLDVAPGVLDPRPDTETLVDAAVETFGERMDASLRIADLGTGSGALLCALLDVFPNAVGVGIDLAPAACALARRNLGRCGFTARGEVRQGGWASAAPGPYDLIVSNPPYIATGDIPGLDPEVRDHDPALALDGGSDGLDAYRALTTVLPSLLATDGWAILEVGAGQAAAASAILSGHGLRPSAVRRDLGGVERALILRP